MNRPTDELQRLCNEYQDRSQRRALYDLYSFYTPSYLFTIQQRERVILKLLDAQNLKNLQDKQILEMGCGSGSLLLDFVKYGASPTKVWGIDFLYDRLKDAKTILPSVNILNADGQYLPFESQSFDILLQFTAFSSILDPVVKSAMAREMMRVLKDNGAILWYDFWLNPTNRQTAGIKPGEIKQLFSNCDYKFRKITLAPPIARKIVPISWPLAVILESLKIFNSHYLVFISKKSD